MPTFPKYESYKDSGFEWLGEIPSHWDFRRLKHIAKVRLSNVDKHSRSNELPVRLCNYTDVYYKDFITNEIAFMEATATEEQISNFPLEEDDILITKDSESFDDIAVPAYVPETLENVICGYHLAHVKPIHIEGSYLFRAFQAEGISSQFRVSANGITRFGIGKSAINDSVFLLPPIEEQKRIVKFLDRTTTEIDRAISQKQRLIKLLQEQKAILINQAVTKGLNPNVPMRDSGVQWIGKIPEHWEVWRSKRLFSQRKEYAQPDDVQLSATQSYGVIPQEEYEERVGRKVTKVFQHLEKRRHVEVGDFVISMRSFQGGLERSWAKGCIRSSYVVLNPSEQVDVDFFSYVFKSSSYISALQSTAIFIRDGQDLNFDNFCAVDLVLPPINEQQNIAQILNETITNIAEAIEAIQKEIDLIQEFRQITISQAVTGKIKV